MFARLAGGLASPDRAGALLFDAGDLVGSAAVSRMAVERHVEPLARALESSGYRALAIGHRDLAATRSAFLATARAVSAHGTPYVLSNLACEASASDLCAAVHDATDPPLVVETPAGRVGFLATLAPSALNFVARDRAEGLTLSDPTASILSGTALARAAGARFVVAVYDPSSEDTVRDALAIASRMGERGPDVLVVHRLSELIESARAAAGSTRLVAARPGEAVEFGPRDRTLVVAPSDAQRAPAPVREFTDALRGDLCSRLAAPLPGGRFGANVERDRFAHFALDVLREHAGAEVGVLPLRTVVAPAGLFPLRGAVTALQLTAALPFDNEVRVASMHGTILRDIVLGSQAARFLFRGVTVEGERVRINDRPLDEEATYRVVSIDYVAEGGDGGLGSDEVSWSPYGSANLREVVLRWFSRARTQDALEAAPDPARRTRWTFRSVLDLSFASTNVENDRPTELTDSQLARSQAIDFSAEGELRADADHPRYRFENGLRLRYGVTTTADLPASLPPLAENTDQILLRSTAVLRRYTNSPTRHPIYVPRLYAEFFGESEFTRPATRSFHHLELRPTAGVRFELWDRLYAYAGGGLSSEVFARAGDVGFPGLPNAGIITAGWALRPGKFFSIRDRDIEGESSLEVAFRDPLSGRAGSGTQIRFRLRAELPLLDWLALSVSYDLFARNSLLPDGAGGLQSAWGAASDLSAGLRLSVTRSVQAFSF